MLVAILAAITAILAAFVAVNLTTPRGGTVPLVVAVPVVGVLIAVVALALAAIIRG